jgi:hypothetical protein
MSYLILLTVLFKVEVGIGQESKSGTIKSWQTFRSDQGYEIKYPDCWVVEIDDPDTVGAISAAPSIFIEESTKCSRVRFDPAIPNGIGIVREMYKTKEAFAKDAMLTEKWNKARVEKKEDLIFKKYKVGKNEVFAYVEVVPSDSSKIRWWTKIYCPSMRSFSITGPTIKNPNPSYYEKFKAGDLALPEPEKTIIESAHCVEPKPKSPSAKR